MQSRVVLLIFFFFFFFYDEYIKTVFSLDNIKGQFVWCYFRLIREIYAHARERALNPPPTHTHTHTHTQSDNTDMRTPRALCLSVFVCVCLCLCLCVCVCLSLFLKPGVRVCLWVAWDSNALAVLSTCDANCSILFGAFDASCENWSIDNWLLTPSQP